MSREAYAPPSHTATLPFYSTAATSAEGSSSGLTQYLCGDCNSKVQLKKGDPIRCKECGHRVLYKERTKRYDFFYYYFQLISVDFGRTGGKGGGGRGRGEDIYICIFFWG